MESETTTGVPVIDAGIQGAGGSADEVEPAPPDISSEADFLIEALGEVDREGLTWMVRSEPVLGRSGKILEPSLIASLCYRGWLRAEANNAATRLPSIVYKVTTDGRRVLYESARVVMGEDLIWLRKIHEQDGVRWSIHGLHGDEVYSVERIVRLWGLGFLELRAEDIGGSPTGRFVVSDEGFKWL